MPEQVLNYLQGVKTKGSTLIALSHRIMQVRCFQ